MTAVTDPIESVIARLRGVKQTGRSNWMAICPSHADSTPSLSVTKGDDGRALLKCHAGCETADIMAKIGLPMGALFPDDKPVEPETIYTYRNADGSVAYQAIRIPQPNGKKTFKQRRPDGRGGWIYDLKGVTRVPYRLPELLAADKVVWIVEGEKDADRLSLYRQITTTNNGGAGNWDDALSPHMLNRHIVILPDNDDTGRKHAMQVADSIYLYAASVRIVQLPGLPEKGDVSDWLNNGGTIEQLQELVKAAPKWTPESEALPEPAFEPPVDAWTPRPISQLVALVMSDDWVWEGFIKRFNTTIFSGLWKTGKSTILAHILRALGGDVQNFVGLKVSPTKVLLITEEHEGHWYTRRETLSIGDHVHVITQPMQYGEMMPTWTRLVDRVGLEIDWRGYECVIFDTLHNLWDVKDENSNSEARDAVNKVKSLAMKGVAVVLVGHTTKADPGFGKANRGASSALAQVDILAEFRLLHPEDIDDTHRVLNARSRFPETPSELVVDYDPMWGYASQGTKAEAAKAERQAILQSILPTVAPGWTIAEILYEWPTHSKPTKGVVQADLNFLAQNKAEFVRVGSGNNCTYWYSRQNAQWNRKD